MTNEPYLVISFISTTRFDVCLICARSLERARGEY